MSIFLKAIDIINERGWGQGDYGGITHPVCLIGACSAAMPDALKGLNGKTFADSNFEQHTYYDYLDELCNGNVPKWNDEICNSKEQAIAKLMEAHNMVNAS